MAWQRLEVKQSIFRYKNNIKKEVTISKNILEDLKHLKGI